MNHGRSAYPDECCGLLLGTNSDIRRVHRVLSVQNANRDSRRNRYNIDPKDLMRADEEARRLHLYIVGIYHSHPDASAQPSQFDLEHAWPYYSYLVLSVQNGEPKDLTAWYLSEDRSTFHLDDMKVIGD
jgi:proteasome lid subunit RPN8/RPN11